MKKGLVFFLIFLCLPAGLMAQVTKTWVPTTGGAWNNASNWSTNSVPATGDEVIIGEQSANITAVPSRSLLSLTINGSCTLIPVSNGRTLTVTGTLTIADGAILSLGTVSSQVLNLNLNASATGIIHGTGSIAINNAQTTGYFNCRGALTIEEGALITGNQNFTLYNRGTLTVANAAGITQSAPAGAVQVTGSRLYQNGNYVYNGSIDQVTGDGLMQNTPNTLTINSTASVSLSSTTTITRMVTVANGTLKMAGYNLTSGSLTGAGNIEGTSGSPVLNVGSDNTSPAAYSGVISDAGATSITVIKVGNIGTLTLAGASTYTGLTTISAGTIKLGGSGDASGSPLGAPASGTIVSINSALDLNGFTLGTAEPLTLNGTGVTVGALTNSSATAVDYSGLITLGRSSSIATNTGAINITNPGTLTGPGFDLTLGGTGNGSVSSIIATGSVTKTGTGTWTLSGANTFTGATSITAGTLKLGSAGDETYTPLGTTASGTTVSINASLDLNGFTIGSDETLTINGTGITAGGALRNTSASAATYSGLITLGSASSIVSTAGDINIINAGITGSFGLTLGGSQNGSVSSVIGTTTVSKNGTGTWTLSGANTFTGLTTISAGTLKLGSAGNTTNTPLGTTSTGTTVSAGAALDLNGFTLAAPETLTLRGTGISNGGALINSSTTTEVGYSGAIGLASASIIGTYSNITSSGVISGGGSLTKAGPATLILSGNNTFTGGLIITTGTVQLGAADRLPARQVTLNGGTFSTGETTGFNETVGRLLLTDNSTIALGTGNHSLRFANSSAAGWTPGKFLTITGWQRTPGISGTEGKIFITGSGLTAAQLSQIKFLIGDTYYTAIFLGIELVPSVQLTITTGTISGSFCAGTSIDVPYTVTGTFVSDNVFTAQLSDAAGDFSSPVEIGHLTAFLSGTVPAIIPISTTAGAGYLVRVVSSIPVLTGSNSGPFTIISASSVNIIPNGSQSICSVGTGVALTASETGGGTFLSRQWGKRTVSGGAITEITGATGVAYTPSGNDLGTGTWYVVCTSTFTCGPTVSNEVTVTVNAGSSWLGGTSNEWNNALNWCGGVPTSTTDALITSSSLNQPVVLSSTTAVCNNLTIETGASLTIEPLAQMTANGITNNGTLNLNSNSTDIFSLIMDNYSGSGTTNAQLFITGGGAPNYNWHYVTEPFLAGISKDFFLSVNAKNLLGYDDSRVTTVDSQGWFKHDGSATTTIAAGVPFTTISYGKGYNFYNGSDATVLLTAATPIGTTLGIIPLQYTGTTDNLPIKGYNLLGNSLTCSLDWDLVEFSASAGHTVYYTTGNRWVSYITGGGATNSGGRYIPPLQGFFVQASAAGATVDFTNAKVHQLVQNRYKKSLSGSNDGDDTKGEYVYPKVKLELNGSGTSDETIVWFNSEATSGFDASYDGHKFFPSDGTGQLYSITGGQNFVINGMSLQSDSIVVPLGMRIVQSGSYSILKKSLEELENYNVYLADRVNGNFKVDMKSNEKYTFSSDAGTVSDRFALIFVSRTKSAEIPHFTNKAFNIYSTAGFINIMPPDDFSGNPTGSVRIYGITGTIVSQANNVGIERGSLIQIPFNSRQGIYIVEIVSGLSRFTGKVVVR